MAPRTALVRCFAIAAMLALPATKAAGQQTSEENARGFVESVAATVYGTAWPTATYRSSTIRSVNRVPDGLDVLVRLSGESAFGGVLWIDLAFEFRKGGFFDLEVRGDNHILVPPFATAKTVAAMSGALVQEFANASADSGNGGRAGPAREPATRQIHVASACPLPVRLWLRYPISPDRSRTEGVWTISPADTTFLRDTESRLQLAGPDVAFYAETTVGNLFWRGDVEVPFGNRTLQMMNGKLPVHADGSYKLGLSCPDYTPPDSTPAEPLVIGALLQDRDSVTVGARTYRRAVVVIGVRQGYPAMRAGMQAGDVIRNINGNTVTSAADVQQSVNDGSQGDRMISVYRPGGSRILVVEPTVAPMRSELDHRRCLESGNPADYYLGAVGAPVRASGGEWTVPVHPLAAGRLFEPSGVDIHTLPGDPPEVFIYHANPVRDDIVRFDYYDRDRALLAVTEAGQFLDLGIRVHCRVQPGIAGATRVTLRQVRDNQVIRARAVPLQSVS